MDICDWRADREHGGEGQIWQGAHCTT